MKHTKGDWKAEGWLIVKDVKTPRLRYAIAETNCCDGISAQFFFSIFCMKKLERCPKCHLVIIPESVRKIWKKKFGTRDKPHYLAICRLCGKLAGEHFGTDCYQS